MCLMCDGASIDELRFRVHGCITSTRVVHPGGCGLQ